MLRNSEFEPLTLSNIIQIAEATTNEMLASNKMWAAPNCFQ